VAWVRANSFQNERALSHEQRLAPPVARHRIPLWMTGDQYVTALQQVGQVQSGGNRLKSRIFRHQVALVSLIFAVIINIET
jgi:hypothetical protein